VAFPILITTQGLPARLCVQVSFDTFASEDATVVVPPHKPGPPLGSVAKTSPQHGRGVCALDAGELEHASSEELKARLLEIFLSPNYRPPVLPKVAIELTELTRKPSASYDDVVGVLQKDPLVVAGVMRLAQSPLYAGRSPLQSLKEAVQRLGINTLRDIVWQVVAQMRLFRVPAFTSILERLQAHSMFMAYASRIVATRAGIASEHAFLCGLLHDVGISGALHAIAETAKDVPLMSLLESIDGMHEQAGGLMARHWRLSPDIATVIEQHHRFDPNRTGVPVLTAVLCVAEHMAAELNFGIMEASAVSHRLFDGHGPGRYAVALKRLKLDGKQAELYSRGEEVAEQLQNMT
jgi:HD-like signal output (HDOD) protein